MFKDKQYQPMKLSAVEQKIDDAIQRVYEAYGTDLPAFFKEIQNESKARLARGTARRRSAGPHNSVRMRSK